jgi:D-erythritol 1-phosphate dehydrogenase
MQDLGTVDCVVIGGGINGAGLARDAAGRGLSVILCEKGDLGEGTSSRSGKLIHGGLRYLEYYEFRLVREALIEREVLLNAAPHIVWPMRFVLPHSPEQRPAWLIRLGLFLYDHLGGRKKLPGSRKLDLHSAPEGQPIKHRFKKAFEYSDCWVDDARLVVLNALDAKERGARILTRTTATSARRVDSLWHVIFTKQDGQTREARAKVLVNAAGPWVDTIINTVVGSNAARRVKLVKGSHIIVPKFWHGPQAYVLQHTDKRLIFVNPYEGNKALIGTTDVPQETQPEDVAITQDEIAYLLAAVNRYIKKPLTQTDVLHTYAGVRPLYDDNAENPSAITRDYVFDVDGTPPMLSVFGGKITTYRKLAEHALERLQPYFPGMTKAWTSSATLPGGDMPDADFEQFLASLQDRYPWLPPQLCNHYARLYGSRASTLVSNAKSVDDLGQHFGHTLYAAEIDYLRADEFAETTEDILYRRTKHYIHLDEKQRAAVADYVSKIMPSETPAATRQ